MAKKTISQLSEKINALDDDVIMIEDKKSTNKITKKNFLKDIIEKKYDDVNINGNELSMSANGVVKKTVTLPSAGTIVEGHTHANKTVLDSITEEKFLYWDDKSEFSGSYNDLTNKPIIPEQYTLPVATSTTLGGIKVGAGLSVTNGVLSATGGGTADSVDWNNIQNKPSVFTPATHNHSYNDLSNKPIIPVVDVTKAYVDEKLDKKADAIYVTYEKFGAVGNGLVDDYIAIKKAHDYANANNLPVKADGSKTYYISNVTEPIIIKTNTDWNNCSIKINEGATPTILDVFKVASKKEPIVISYLSGITINKATKNIPQLAGYGECFVDVINSNKKQFIRKGSNADAGYNQTDQFRIDNKGNVLDDIIWDFDRITSITLYPVDDSILNIGNVNFVTIENTVVNTNNTYLRKGLLINRSNVVVSNIKHRINEHSSNTFSPVRGIIYFHTCCNVVIKDSSIPSRRCDNSVGTYGLNHYKVVNATIDNVVDENFLDATRWGVHTSNYAKNLKFYNCKLSRIDAHKGVWNLTLRDVELGFQGLRLVGGGLLIVDNLTSYCGTLVAFRKDYGSSWNGRVRMRNIVHKPRNVSGLDANNSIVKVFYFDNDMTHDFGYQCYHTLGIQLENYYLYNYNENTNNGVFDLVTISDSTFTNAAESCRVRFPYELTFKNIKTNNGGFRLITGYLHAFRVGVPFSYAVGDESYNTTARNLDITPNVTMTLDDVKIAKISTSNIVALKGLGRVASDDYTNINTRILPKIVLKQCRDIVNSLAGYCFVLDCTDCTFISGDNASSGTRHIATYNNCIFEPLLANTSDLGFRMNTVTVTYMNCHFKRPVYLDGSPINKSNIANCYGFLNYNAIKESDTSFRSLCSFIGCRIDNAINPKILFSVLSNFIYDFNSSYGTKYKR